MRTTPVIAALVGLLALTSCGGAGRPSTEETLKRLNTAGVTCAIQDTGLALVRGKTDKSCRTPDGIEIGITRFASDGAQEAFVKNIGAQTNGTVFRVMVYDYGYVMFVPDEKLGRRVAQVMDAQSYIAANRACPQARGGICPR